MKKTFLERLGKEWLFYDGGSGSLIQAKGLKIGELPETWNIKRPEAILEINRAYLEAGSDVILTNTFGCNGLKFKGEVETLVTAAVNIAKQARKDASKEDAFIGLDIGPTGKLLEPLGNLAFEDAVKLYSEVVKAGVKAGCDLIHIETMQDSYETKAAVLAAKENCDLPVVVTVVFDEKGKMLTGGTPESITAMLEGLRVDALGVNCSLGPKQMIPIVKRLCEVSSLPIVVKPNAGLPKTDGEGKTYYDLDANKFVYYMDQISDLPVHALGGCCGTTPEFIEKLIKKVKDKPFRSPTPKHRSVVSSFSQCVEIGKKPIIIGERINPTGKKRFKEALRQNDIDYILGEGLKQEDLGAHILDVNVGLPEIDEPEMIKNVVKKLQSVLALPLQIDTSDPVAMELSLRHYNGKALINSVNGKQEVMDSVFPLVKKYGGIVVGLTLDEDGIPDNADGRIDIAKKIYKEAEKYGIQSEDILIDGLAMTISSDPTSAMTTLETVRRVHGELHGHTILGVSNISFGLPQRAHINANFYTMAMQNGLSCAIINPGSDAMMSSWRSYCALMNLDDHFETYINAYAGQTVKSVKPKEAVMSLKESIQRGIESNAASATKEALKDRDGLTIINEELIPALDEVGKGYESGKLFLPQLLMSAEAAKAAFGVIKEAMAGKPRKIKGRIILATVKGDIHDIGKNIVKVLLENYGYDVIDLGKDVDPEIIVDTAIKEDIKLVGLSALMTTTVVSMEDTIKLLKEKKPDTKVVVGGAVMTQKYADQIGADYYGKDAMDTVRYAETLFC